MSGENSLEEEARASPRGDTQIDGEEHAAQGGESPEEDFLRGEQSGRRKRRRQSLNNPKIVPRAEAESSSLRLLAAKAEEVSRREVEYNDPAHEVLRAKLNFLNILVANHLQAAGFARTAEQLERELTALKPHRMERVELAKARNLKSLCAEALRSGSEKSFFEHRKQLHAELNYYTDEFRQSLELETKTRVFFAAFYLINVERLKLDYDEARKRTLARLESLKAFFAQRGSELAQDESLKQYLRVPALIEKMPRDNQTLNFVLSTDFADQIVEANSLELDSILVFVTSSLTHRSFVSKVYEFFLKLHPDGQSEVHQKIYASVQEAMAAIQASLAEHQAEIEELGQLQQTLERKTADLKQRYKGRVEDEMGKAKKVRPAVFSPEEVVVVSQVSSAQRELNRHYYLMRDEIDQLLKEIEALDEIVDGKKANPDVPSEKEWAEAKQRLTQLRLKKMMLDMKKPKSLVAKEAAPALKSPATRPAA